MAAQESNDNVGEQTFRSGVNFQVWSFLIPLSVMELIAGVSYVLH